MSKTIAVPKSFKVPGKENEPEKTIRNPWSGSVTIVDQLVLSQVELIEAGMSPVINETFKVWYSTLDKPKLPAILACVEKWDLKDFPNPATVENFPMHNRRASHELINFLFREVTAVYMGELEIPNE